MERTTVSGLQPDITPCVTVQAEEGVGCPDDAAQREEDIKVRETYRHRGQGHKMSVSYSHVFCQLLLLQVLCRRANTNLFVSENATVITDSPVGTPGPNAPPLAPLSPPLTERRSVVLTGENQTEYIEVVNPVTLDLECTWTEDNKRLPNVTAYWIKDGQTIEDSNSNIQLQNGRYHLKKDFSILSEEDLGNYSCVFGLKAKVDFVVAVPYLGEVRDKPIVSYVGDSVVMICKLDEKKSKPNTWNWYISNGTNKVPLESDSIDHRYKITVDGKKTKLLVHNLTEADSGLYYCGAVYGIAASVGYMQLRVITFYEPLKPFIGILVEVVVLVTIILLYEKTGSKKDNQSGNEGHADHNATLSQGDNPTGEGQSSTRQRKV